ncbi:hypothetical protein I552_6079 [Mycobacterium xenopi 3993]|nr:hypothetical protein I552_6079 [Mycobacterium xenopi 3993]
MVVLAHRFADGRQSFGCRLVARLVLLLDTPSLWVSESNSAAPIDVSYRVSIFSRTESNVGTPELS